MWGLNSCMEETPYHHFETVAQEGWDVRDSVTFCTDTMPETGTYTAWLCVRMNEEYPYRNFAAMVSVYVNRDTKPYRRTYNIDVKREDGTAIGNGVVLHTYEVPIAKRTLRRGDSLRIVVQHRMRRELLPGIKDVGIAMKQGRKEDR